MKEFAIFILPSENVLRQKSSSTLDPFVKAALIFILM